MKFPPLDFEKPIIELEEKLADLKKHSRAHDINFDHEVRRMEGKIEETKRAASPAGSAGTGAYSYSDVGRYFTVGLKGNF